MSKPDTLFTDTSESKVPLVGGQELTITNRGVSNVLILRDASCRVTLTIEVTDKGPILRFDSPGLAIQTTGALSLEAETLSLRGRKGLELTSGGDAAIHVEGDLVTSARIQTVRAELGNVNLEANDDVRLVGERVLLNC
jgi:hypothetical protein